MSPGDGVPGRRWRVLHVIETLGLGGAEVLLTQTLPLLARRVDVRVAALRPPASLLQTLRSAGIEAEVLGASGTPAVRLVPALRRAMRDVDIVHTHLFWPSAVASLARVAMMRGPKLVTSLHSVQYWLPDEAQQWRLRARRAMDWGLGVMAGDAIVAVSEAVAAEYRRYYPAIGPWRDIQVIHNGMNVDSVASRVAQCDRGAARLRWNFAPGQFAIASIGRLTRQKNFPGLFDAVARVRDAGIDARAVVVGDGPDRAALERAAPPFVAIHGPADRDAVCDLLAACDVYVQPSLWEGFGLAILEAMASRRPVVATSVDGIVEVVACEQTGLLVPPGDAAAMADALVRLANDRAMRERFGENGFRRSIERFDVSLWVDRTLALYERIASCA